MEPRPPKRKKFCRGAPEEKLPIIETIAGPYRFIGTYDGFSVTIQKQSEMEKINNWGSFGKGTLSRNYPSYNKIEMRILRKRQCELYDKITSNKNLEPQRVIEVNDSDSEPIESCRIKQVKTPFVETLRLSPEEAYYLITKNCLNVYYDSVTNVWLPKPNAWTIFAKNKEFIKNFIVYNYFRENDWVVKPGIKFGGDFLLYKDGPAFYHASFLVVIDVIRSVSKERVNELCTRSMDWTSLTCLDRLTETAAKELLIAQVSWPENLSIEKVQRNMPCLVDFPVTPLLIRRWVPKTERSKFCKNNQWKNKKK